MHNHVRIRDDMGYDNPRREITGGVITLAGILGGVALAATVSPLAGAGVILVCCFVGYKVG